MTTRTIPSIPRIACIGECMVELSSAENGLFLQAFAGDTLNTAIYAARSAGNALNISYITALGTDHFSDRMIDLFQSEKLHCDWVARLSDKLPGLYAIELDSTGERSFSYWRSDSAAKQMFSRGLSDEQKNTLADAFDLYYLSGITLAILNDEDRSTLKDILVKARSRGARVAYDSNYRPRLWSSKAQAQSVTRDFLAITDIALVTFDDEQMLFDDESVSDTLGRMTHIDEVVVKQGEEGCTVVCKIDSNQSSVFVPTTPVSHVVDTTSAGDSFNGAYLARRVLGHSPEDAARFAHRLAGTVIQYKGAIIPEVITSQLLEMEAVC